MKKIIVALFGLLDATFSLGQTEINNSHTEYHVQIPGTTFFLIPPQGFISASHFQGFHEESTGASILVTEIPGPFHESTKGFNEAGFETQGIQLAKKEDIRVNGHQGLLLTTEQEAHGISFAKYILVYGDHKSTYMINGAYPKELSHLDSLILKSILSVIHVSGLDTNPVDAASFTIETRNTKLKFGKSITGMLLYTVDGKVPTESHDKTMFLVGHSLSRVRVDDQKNAAINRIKKMPYHDVKVDERKVKEVKINGLSGYEIVGEGLDNHTKQKDVLYQVMLFTDKGYYILVGTSKDDHKKNLALFKKVTKTMKQKK